MNNKSEVLKLIQKLDEEKEKKFKYAGVKTAQLFLFG